MESGADNEPNIEEFKEANKFFANKIKDMINSFQLTDEETRYPGLCFRTDSNRSMCFYVIQERDEFIREEGLIVPVGFNFPAYLVRQENIYGRYDLDRRVVTQYGILPELFIGLDNKLYVSIEDYLFNLDGQAIKYGCIACVSEDDVDSHDDLDNEVTAEKYLGSPDYKKIQKVDCIPDIEMSHKPMTLETGDYEKMGYILDQIKSGNWNMEK